MCAPHGQDTARRFGVWECGPGHQRTFRAIVLADRAHIVADLATQFAPQNGAVVVIMRHMCSCRATRWAGGRSRSTVTRDTCVLFMIHKQDLVQNRTWVGSITKENRRSLFKSRFSPSKRLESERAGFGLFSSTPSGRLEKWSIGGLWCTTKHPGIM